MISPEFGRFLLSNISDGALVADIASKTITFANKPAHEILGYAAGELAGKDIDSLLPEGKGVIDLVRSKIQYDLESILINSKGKKFPVEIKAGVSGDKVILVFTQKIIPDKTIDLFRKFVELSDVLMVEIDKEGNLQQVNRAASQFLGIDHGNEQRKNWFNEFVAEEDREQLTLRFKEGLEGNDNFCKYCTYCVVNEKGEKKLVGWKHHPLLDKNGKVQGYIGAGEDLSEITALRQKLELANSSIEPLFKNMEDGVLILDEVGNIIRASPGFLKITGFDESVTHRNHILSYFREQDQLDFLKKQMERRREGKTDSYEINFLRPDDTYVWLKLTVSPILDNLGQFIGSITIIRDHTKQRETQTLLEETERAQRLLLEAIPDSILVVNSSGTVLHYQNDLKDILKQSDSKIKGKNLKELFASELADLLQFKISKAIDTGEVRFQNFTIQQEDSTLVFEARVIKRDPDSAIVMLRNRSEETRDRFALKQSEERHGAMLKAIRDEIFRIDNTGKVLDYKPSQVQDSPKVKETSSSEKLDDYFPPEISLLHQEAVSLTLKNREIVHYEYEREDDEDEEGAVRYFEATTAPSFQEAILIIRDITEKRNSLNELVHSRNLYTNAEKVAHFGSFEYDFKARQTKFSEGFYKIHGVKPGAADFTELTAISFIHPDDRERVREEITSALERGENLTTNYRILKKDNGEVSIHLVTRIMLDSNNNIRYLMGVIQDVTDLFKLERDLQQRNQELSTFIYKTSHSLRSPITSALGLLNLGITAKEGEVKEYLTMTSQLIRKLDRILLELINVVMIKEGNMKPELVDLASFVDDLLTEFKYQDNYRNIVFSRDIPENLSIVIDIALLRAILSNLLENSAKYSKTGLAGAFVKVEAKRNHSYLYISVRDNGIGIPEELQDKVFDMFYRAHQGGKGTGMGLYIVRNAVQKVGGEITIKSKPDEGTEITIRIPLEADKGGR